MMTNTNPSPVRTLGKDITGSASFEEAINKAHLNWGVHLKDLFYLGDDEEQIPVPNRAVIRDDTLQTLGVVGSNYTPLQNMEAFKIFEPLVTNKLISMETAGQLRGGRKIWLLAKVDTPSLEVAPGDEILPYILVSNSHDGSTSARLGFTPIRVICENTLAMAHSSEQSRLIRVFHSRNIYTNLEALRDAMDLASSSFKMQIEQYRHLASRQISREDLIEYVKLVFPKKKGKTTEEEDQEASESMEKDTPTHEKIIYLFENGRGSDLPGSKSYWGAYNAVNEFLMYESGKEDDIRLEQLWFKKNASINRNALQIALKAAA